MAAIGGELGPPSSPIDRFALGVVPLRPFGPWPSSPLVFCYFLTLSNRISHTFRAKIDHH